MADRFGRAGGNWSAAGTWSATSGGGSDGAGLNAGDAVILDANSSGTFTIDGAISIVTLDCTGFTGTLVHNSVILTVSGNTFKLVAGMTHAPAASRTVIFTSTSGTTAITTAGKTLGIPQFNGAGGTFQFQDAFACVGTCTLTAGTLDANNQSVTLGAMSSTGAGVTRAITMGSGTWTINGASGTIWDLASAAANLTLTAGTSTLLFSGTANGTRTAQFGTSKTYATVTIANAGTTGAIFELSANTGVTIGTLNFTTPVNARFNTTATYTISNAVNWAGTAFNNANMFTAANTPTLAMNGGTIAWAVFQGLAVTGTPPTTTNSFDLEGNSGFTINAPSGGAVSVIGS
jgi:hypothetical protein